MPGALAVLRAVANDPEMSRSLRLAAIDSALGCKCPDGIKIWIEATRLANSSGDRSRLGVAAIERGIVSEDWSGISDERQLNQRRKFIAFLSLKYRKNLFSLKCRTSKMVPG